MVLLLTRLKYVLEDYTLTFCAETEAGEDEFMWGRVETVLSPAFPASLLGCTAS